MELTDAIKGRRSIRKFTDRVIPTQVIEKIVEEASYSPSWKNSQTPRYIYLTNREIIDKIANEMLFGFEHNKEILNGCAGIMVVAYVTKIAGFDRDGSFSTPKGDGFEMFDAGIATQTLCLSAHNQGIGTVITGYFDERPIHKLLELPENQEIGALVCMGYPDEEPPEHKRRELSQILSYME